jgi:hypothetical protein
MKIDFELTRIKQMTMRGEGGMGKKVGLPDFDSESGGWGGNGRHQVLSALGNNFPLGLAEKISLKKFDPEQIGRICGNYDLYFVPRQCYRVYKFQF